MEIHKAKILFLLARNRVNKAGKCPIRCRITYKKERHEFATGQFIKPAYWQNKQQLVKPPTGDNNFINSQLSLIKTKINQAFLFLQVQNEEFNPQDIYNQYRGKPTIGERSILKVFDLHNARMEKLIGVDYSKHTYDKFIETRKHIYQFLSKQYGRKDYLLSELGMKFIHDLDFYFKTERKQQQSTINKHIQRYRKIITLAIVEGYLEKDPFLLYKPKKTHIRLIYLDADELKRLEQYVFKQKKLEQVKDMFIFCCYTGLAYREMANLEQKHLVKGFDDGMWIKMPRQKTNGNVSVPLLPKALKILDKYLGENKTLPVISNQKFNSYLKEIASIVGIEKKLTHHIARKTFATTVLLYNDVPMEIVSELLGHSKMAITQKYYAKVVQKKVSKTMNDLAIKLDKKQEG